MKFFLKNFGCQINTYDLLQIIFILKKNFFKTTNFNFDFLIINTCSVREYCQKKIFFFLKKNLWKFLTILNGCFSNLFFLELIKKKYINIIINSFSLFFLNFLIYNFYFYNCKQIFFKNFFKIKNFKLLKSHNIFILSNGCNKYCSYCIIPYSRGREHFEDFFLIIKKLFLIKKNKEIFFLGQNVNYYKFFWFKKILNFYFFLKILFQFCFNYILNFLTLNIKNISISLDFYKNLNFIHLPLQSASNYILIYIMKRNYNFNFYKNFIYFIKKNFFYFLFTTDIIICFFKEINLFFNKTLLSIEKLFFDKSYIFIYNIRSFTSSIFFLNNINLILKKKRFFKIHLKLKKNIIYIKNMFINKIYYVYLKGISLNFNFLFFSFFNNRLFFFFKNKLVKFFILNKLIIKKFFKKIFFCIF